MRRKFLLLFLMLLLPGCSSLNKPGQADFAALYNRAAKHQGIERNPVIVIPGVMGSILKHGASGDIVWGKLGVGTLDPDSDRARQLAALPLRENGPYDDLSDGVVSSGVLENVDINIAGIPISIKAYQQVLRVLGAGGYRDSALHSTTLDYGKEHFTCFQFDYDWRQSCAHNAALLHDFILEQEAYLKQQYVEKYGENVDRVKFTIVAHSMGGLITRYYLRYGNQKLPKDGSLPIPTWSGAERVEQAILIATPNAGSLNAMKIMLDGMRLPPFGHYDTAVTCSFASLYELLPRPRHNPFYDENEDALDFLSPDVWEENQWGMANPDQRELLATLLPDMKDPAERQRLALSYQANCLRRAEQFHRALDRPLHPPDDFRYRLILGDAEPTMKTAWIKSPRNVEWKDTASGDGTVLRSSALMDERLDGDWTPKIRTPIRWHSVGIQFRDHIGLTQSPEFHDNLLYILLEEAEPITEEF